MTQIYAHRGASRVLKENTLEAFKHAETLGAGWVELDVWLSKDSILTVHHDLIVETGDNIIESGYSSFPGDVPTLQDVVASTDNLGINVEVKTRNNLMVDVPTRRLIDELARLLEDVGESREFLVSSFNFPCLTYFRDKSPGTPVGFLVWELDDDWESLIAKVAESDFQAIHPANGIVSRDFVAACKKRNLDVNVWTVNDEDRMEELLGFGVDGIITDVPDVALEVVKGRGR